MTGKAFIFPGFPGAVGTLSGELTRTSYLMSNHKFWGLFIGHMTGLTPATEIIRL